MAGRGKRSQSLLADAGCVFDSSEATNVEPGRGAAAAAAAGPGVGRDGATNNRAGLAPSSTAAATRLSLWQGGARASKDREGLRRAGVTDIINCAGKQHFVGEFAYHRCFFEDKDATPELCEGFRRAVFSALALLELEIPGPATRAGADEGAPPSAAAGDAGDGGGDAPRRRRPSARQRVVLVHCMGGVSRSAAVATAIVMVLRALPRDEALRQVCAARPQARIKPGFWSVLGELEEEWGLSAPG